MRFKSILFILSFCCLMLTAFAEGDKVSYKEMAILMETVGENCDPKPSKETIRKVLRNEKDVDMEIKCFRRCLMELFDLHVADSTQMREETASEFFSMAYPDKKDEILVILKTCNDRNAVLADPCEAAHEHAMCLQDEMELKGFEMPEIDDE